MLGNRYFIGFVVCKVLLFFWMDYSFGEVFFKMIGGVLMFKLFMICNDILYKESLIYYVVFLYMICFVIV